MLLQYPRKFFSRDKLLFLSRQAPFSFKTRSCFTPPRPPVGSCWPLSAVGAQVSEAWAEGVTVGCSAPRAPFTWVSIWPPWAHQDLGSDARCQLALVPESPSPLGEAGSRWHTEATQAEESLSLLWQHLSQQAVQCPAFGAGHRPAKPPPSLHNRAAQPAMQQIAR